MNDSTPSGLVAAAKPTAAQVAQMARRQRARDLMRRVLFWVVLPTLLSAVYLYMIARDQYESVSTVMVRNGNATQMVMLEQFLLSRDSMNRLEQRMQFAEHYAKRGDYWFGMSKKAGSETRYKLFRRMVNVVHDPATSVITISAKAFSSSHANRAVRAMLEEGQTFLSKLDPAQTAAPLVVLAQPSQPNESSYPNRGYGVLTAFFVSLSLFVIAALLIAAVREHAQF